MFYFIMFTNNQTNLFATMRAKSNETSLKVNLIENITPFNKYLITTLIIKCMFSNIFETFITHCILTRHLVMFYTHFCHNTIQNNNKML